MNKKRDTSKLPPMEYRLIFVQYLRRSKSRFNPSLSRFLDLPAAFRHDIEERWAKRHPRLTMPDAELSLPKPKKEKKR